MSGDDPEANVGVDLPTAREARDEALEAMFVPTRSVALWPFVVGVTAVLALVVGSVWWWSEPEPQRERVDPKVANAVREMLPMIESKVPTARGPFIAAALVELLENRVPGGVRQSLREVQDVPSPYGRVVWMNVLTKPSVVKLWRRVCPKGAEVLAELAREGRKDGGLFIYQRCKLDRMKLLEVNHALESGGPEILLAHAIYAHLEAEETLTDLDVRALRALARSSSEVRAAPSRLDAPSVHVRPDDAPGRLRPAVVDLPPRSLFDASPE